jgi:hypothetical protein
MNMQQNDDERFENFLKQFRPRAPRPLTVEKPVLISRRPFTFLAWAAAAVLLVGALLVIDRHTGQIHLHDTAANPAAVDGPIDFGPLTVRSANALLARMPDDRAALNDLAFHSQTIPLSNGRQSALAVLSEEKIKL